MQATLKLKVSEPDPPYWNYHVVCVIRGRGDKGLQNKAKQIAAVYAEKYQCNVVNYSVITEGKWNDCASALSRVTYSNKYGMSGDFQMVLLED